MSTCRFFYILQKYILTYPYYLLHSASIFETYVKKMSKMNLIITTKDEIRLSGEQYCVAQKGYCTE